MNKIPSELQTLTNRRKWLKNNLNPKFFKSMLDEPEAVQILERELNMLQNNRRLLLADRDDAYIIASLNSPGSFYSNVSKLGQQDPTLAVFAHSTGELPGTGKSLEVHRLSYQQTRPTLEEINSTKIKPSVLRPIKKASQDLFPELDFSDLEKGIKILAANNESYVAHATPTRVARLARALTLCNSRNGLYYNCEVMEGGHEARIQFCVANPPQRGFLAQCLEVFNRMGYGVNRAYCLNVSNGTHPYFLGTFIIFSRDGKEINIERKELKRLRNNLYNTQIMCATSRAYLELISQRKIKSAYGILMNAFAAFCHTTMAHNQADRYDMAAVESAFIDCPAMSTELVQLFLAKFDPEKPSSQNSFEQKLRSVEKSIKRFNTGHRHLDEVRRKVYTCALSMIKHTLKTNFFVHEKQAIAFRLDPKYLAEIGNEFTSDLPEDRPFRITFFFSRFGFGYHIGFSDIARGGWRTIIARSKDDYLTASETLFKEVYVLAHTQHLKNKDIYEGGSKMAIILNSSTIQRDGEQDLELYRLYKLQFGFTSAFLDIFTTEAGVARDERVIDYYRNDEPIELGPDENMHDNMVEAIAKLSQSRGYILGSGVISSKKVGINHKEFGVTSTGVIRFAEIVMKSTGIDMHKDSFSVKITGGPDGDVAGNAMRLLLERCPKVSFPFIIDGTALVFDPKGIPHKEMKRLVLKHDLDAIKPANLNDGAFILYRTETKTKGLSTLYKKVSVENGKASAEWISQDEFSDTYSNLLFTVEADLFIPAGGRPETIDESNWDNYIVDGKPSARIIVEGANSFITPPARVKLQESGVIIMRDASANKCGVISSSYEIIANLLFTDEEFLANKAEYVADAVDILNKRASNEATLIIKRKTLNPEMAYTEISNSLSREINANYESLYNYFCDNPKLIMSEPYVKAIHAHLPKFVMSDKKWIDRIGQLPQKYLAAILAAEIGSSMVYNDDASSVSDKILSHIQRFF